MPKSWLRVFRHADAPRMGAEERQQGHTKAMRQKNAGPCGAQRRPGMRLSVMMFDPHVPDTPTAILSTFSFYFNDIERFTKLATSSYVDAYFQLLDMIE